MEELQAPANDDSHYALGIFGGSLAGLETLSEHIRPHGMDLVLIRQRG
jgi:hypothetical protein